MNSGLLTATVTPYTLALESRGCNKHVHLVHPKPSAANLKVLGFAV